MNQTEKRWSKRLAVVGTTSIALLLVIAAAAYACTNYVGEMKVFGNRGDTQTVTVTGLDSNGDPDEAMLQDVSDEIARADNESGGWFQVWTGPGPNNWDLASGTYDVNWIQKGYDDHYNWDNPNGDCMSWTSAPQLGTVTINGSGNITGGSGTYYISYASNWVKFDLPTASANSNPEESGVCISDSGSHDGNQAPLKLV